MASWGVSESEALLPEARSVTASVEHTGALGRAKAEARPRALEEEEAGKEEKE